VDEGGRQVKSNRSNNAAISIPSFPDLKLNTAVITGIGWVGMAKSSTWGIWTTTAYMLAHTAVKVFGWYKPIDLSSNDLYRTCHALFSTVDKQLGQKSAVRPLLCCGTLANRKAHVHQLNAVVEL